MARFKKLCASFSKARDGGIAIMVAIVLLLLIAILMVTVDLGRMQSGSANNQGAIDATALSAAEYAAKYRIINNLPAGLPNDLREYAREQSLQNLETDQSDATLANDSPDGFKVVAGNGQLVISACLNIKTNFANSLGQGAVQKVCNSSTASLPSVGNIEIVLALDSSYSMLSTYPSPSGAPIQKLEALRQSVNKLMDTYAASNSIYWGVVPYTGMVDLGNMAPNIVANDLSSGLPGDELSPAAFTLTYLTPPQTINYIYKYHGLEDLNTFGEGSVFYDPHYNPPNWPNYGLNILQRFPLTSREGNANPEIASSIVLDDAPPTSGRKFQAYWHQPYDFFIEYDSTTGNCGSCETISLGNTTVVETATQAPVTCQGTYYDPCRDPSAPSSACPPNNPGPGNPPGGINE